MIRKVVLRRFKRFDELTVNLGGPVVFAGPNNSGKTTVLQAIAAWRAAVDAWQQHYRYQRSRHGYAWAPLTRDRFYAVPLPKFEDLWREQAHKEPIEIEVHGREGWTVTMELRYDTREQVRVRPKYSPSVKAAFLRELRTPVTFVPPLAGIGIEEPEYQAPFINQRLGQGRAADVLRNLLVEAHRSGHWDALASDVAKTFGHELLPPSAEGRPHIRAEYRTRAGGPPFDLVSAGSGFLQYLLLSSFLHMRPGTVLLIDEPDAHLHVFLQETLYAALVRVAAERGSQIIVATHAPEVIESVPAREIRILRGEQAVPLDDERERKALVRSLGVLTQGDIVLLEQAVGVLYTEDYTDRNLLSEWARILGHPAYDTLARHVLWKKMPVIAHEAAEGVPAQKHYESIRLYKKVPAVCLVDGDAKGYRHDSSITGHGLQTIRWRRYEAESYLVHPDAIARYVEHVVGDGGAAGARDRILDWLEQKLGTRHIPVQGAGNAAVEAYFRQTKARTEIIPPLLTSAGLPGASDHTHYDQIAAIMLPSEIHPEIIEKLDAIQKAFGLAP